MVFRLRRGTYTLEAVNVFFLVKFLSSPPPLKINTCYYTLLLTDLEDSNDYAKYGHIDDLLLDPSHQGVETSLKDSTKCTTNYAKYGHIDDLLLDPSHQGVETSLNESTKCTTNYAKYGHIDDLLLDPSHQGIETSLKESTKCTTNYMPNIAT